MSKPCSYFYSFLGISIFSDASVSTWAHDHWGGAIYIYGGSFSINGTANNYLNSNDYEISACNEIVINGDVEFVATGNHELILTSGEIPDCQSDSYLSLPDDILSDYHQRNEKSDSTFEKNTVNCYPNPCSDVLHIELILKNSQTVTLSLTNIISETITSFNKENLSKGNHKLSIVTKNINPGVYFLKTNIEDCEQAIKIVKTN